MNELELFGNYYKVFKGNGGLPEKVTVIAIDGDTVTFVRGHYSKEELENTVGLTENKCNVNKILIRITPKQKAIIDKEDKKFQEYIDKADRSLEDFKN